jgi:hypothetical protein
MAEFRQDNELFPHLSIINLNRQECSYRRGNAKITLNGKLRLWNWHDSMFVCAHPSAKAGRGCVSTPYQKLIHKWWGGGGLSF